MTKNIMALFGSNRIGGSTDKLLSQAICGAHDAGCTVDRVDVAHLEMAPCRQTYGCMFEPGCSMGGMDEYFQMMKKADGLIIAAPVMTFGIPGAMKSFMDRFQPFYMAKYYRKRPLITQDHAKIRRTLFLSVAGMNEPDVFIGSLQTLKAFCAIIDAPCKDTVLQSGMDILGNIDKKPEVLEEAYIKGKTLGERIVQLRGGS